MKTNKDQFPIDYSKLNKEDRRWLLHFFTEQTKWNANNILSSLAIYVSVISLMVSSLTLLYTFQGKVIALVIGLGVVYSFLLIFSTINFFNAKRLFSQLAKGADKRYKEIFRMHFKYAESKGAD
ncbi:hypothetical protein J4470_02770 [Candidatus Woesearchaeota archaeon]|nr:hypothetical protein [Candidatus Woesearchaeota archaeon]